MQRKAGCPEIRQKKPDIIWIKNILGETKICLRIEASKDDWMFLMNQITNIHHKKQFVQNLSKSFLEPVAKHIVGKIKWKQGQKFDQQFTDMLKIHAGVLYSFFARCLKTHSDLPHYLRFLHNHPSLKKDYFDYERKDLSKSRKEYDATAFTAYCMQLIHGERLSQNKIKPFFAADDMEQGIDSFYVTYAKEGMGIIKKDPLWYVYFSTSLPYFQIEIRNQDTKATVKLLRDLDRSIMHMLREKCAVHIHDVITFVISSRSKKHNIKAT
jgi:hypothetical protein